MRERFDPALAAPVNPADGPTPPLSVLYDGACPLCRREIGLYRGLRQDTPARRNTSR